MNVSDGRYGGRVHEETKKSSVVGMLALAVLYL